MSIPDLTKSIIGVLKRDAGKMFTARQIHKKVRSANNINDVRKILDKLVRAKTIFKNEDDRYGAHGEGRPRKTSGRIITGKVDMIRSGAAFLISEDTETDVFIQKRWLSNAYNGDTVRVQIFKSARGRRLEGKIIEVIQRSKTQYAGIYREFKNHKLVMIIDKHNHIEVDLDKGKHVEAKDFDKVVVEITHWPEHRAQSLRGRMVENLGPSGSNDAEMLSLLVDQGFPLSFPAKVENEAQQLAETASFEIYDGREDFREVLTITIDPVDAKDFDDALSYRELEGGDVEIGIHIADVSHYVKPGSHLDKDAAERGNSVYLVDRVIPMLPENLSNGLCSLRPDEEKYTFSVICVFTKDGRLKKHRFSKTLIKSDRRFAYEEAQEFIESGEGKFGAILQHMNKIAEHLRKGRIRNGSIGFETDEVRFNLDENGRPVSVYVKKRQEAHMMIEDYMLLANKLVAQFITKKSKSKPIPFPYRIHDEPDPTKLHDFSLLAMEFGIDFHLNTPKQIAASMNQLMDKAKEDDSYKTLVPMAIRSMAKAEYSIENIGHFGLAFENYCHFTSPIRRYADLLVHRILFANLKDTKRMDPFKVEAICTHISAQERKAQVAERESIKYKQTEYLKEREGEVFVGVVVSMIDKGFFVTLKDNLCEGMVAFSTLNEPFDVDALSSSFTGRRTGRHVKIGDEIMVRVEHADLFTRRVDLTWVEDHQA
jgi:ribonuclease R